MRKWLTMLVCGTAFVVGVVTFLTPADARRGGGARMGGGHAYGHAHAGRAFRGGGNRNWAANRNININRNAAGNLNRQYAYRNGRRGYWNNGIWIAAPVLAGTAAYGYSGSCAYLYRRWQSTGSAYWRNRYNQCAN